MKSADYLIISVGMSPLSHEAAESAGPDYLTFSVGMSPLSHEAAESAGPDNRRAGSAGDGPGQGAQSKVSFIFIK
jgi:hypothetical protein